MIRLVSFLFCIVIFLASCSQKPDANAVLDYYGKMQAAMLFYHDEQQKFIDTATEAINQLQYDGMPDGQRLRILLNHAKQGNRSRRNMIDTLQEIDNAIGYKQKVLEYTDTFYAAYNNEFTAFINLLENKASKEVILAFLGDQLKPKLIQIQEKEESVRDAKTQLKEKYNLENADALINKANELRKEHTGGN